MGVRARAVGVALAAAGLGLSAVTSCGPAPNGVATPSPSSPDAMTLGVPDGGAVDAAAASIVDVKIAVDAGDPRCDLHPGEIRDDETPDVSGVGAAVDSLAWFASRGVVGKAYRTLVARYGNALGEDGFGPCQPVVVGDPAEDALVCRLVHVSPVQIVEVHATVFVVRGRAPSAVLDVGLGAQAMDFPEARQLDLSLRIADGGLEAELRDRAPPGSMLVASRAACEASRGMSTYRPTPLHGCVDGIAGLRAVVAAADPKTASGLKTTLAFMTKSCAQVGVWKWQKDRFVKAP